MRVSPSRFILYSVAIVAAVLAQPLGAQSKDPAVILASARQAMGGEAKLSAVKSFTATGRTRQVRGDNLVPIEFELFVELPDKYLRKDEVPAQESGPSATGFNGEELVVDPPQPTPQLPPGAPAPNPAALDAARKARVTNVKQDFARLALGMFAASYPAYPLTFSYVGEAEAPQGKADVLDAKGPNNFTIRFFIHQQTHLPIMVSWQGAAGRPRPRSCPPRRCTGPAADRPQAGAADLRPLARRQPLRVSAERLQARLLRVRPPRQAHPPLARHPPRPPRLVRRLLRESRQVGLLPVRRQQVLPLLVRRRRAAPRPAAGAGPAMPAPVENRLYFADYRETDGVQFPFRLRRAVGAGHDRRDDLRSLQNQPEDRSPTLREPQIATRRLGRAAEGQGFDGHPARRAPHLERCRSTCA